MITGLCKIPKGAPRRKLTVLGGEGHAHADGLGLHGGGKYGGNM